MFKKLLIATTAITIGAVSQQAMANNATKINVVKQAYKDAITCLDMFCGIDPLHGYMNTSFKRASDHALHISHIRPVPEDTPVEDFDHQCWQWDETYRYLLNSDIGSDGSYKLSNFQFTALKNGNIKVTATGNNKRYFGNSRIEIALSQSGNSYKIADVYNNGKSLKNRLLNCHL